MIASCRQLQQKEYRHRPRTVIVGPLMCCLHKKVIILKQCEIISVSKSDTSVCSLTSVPCNWDLACSPNIPSSITEKNCIICSIFSLFKQDFSIIFICGLLNEGWIISTQKAYFTPQLCSSSSQFAQL